MKIGILCPGFGWVRRGVERVAEEVVSRLGNGDQPLVYSLCRNSTGRDSAGLVARGVRLRKVPAVPRTHPMAKIYSPLARRAGIYMWGPGDFEAITFAVGLIPLLLRDRPDLILNLGGPAVGKICQLLRRLRGTPFLHSAQGMAQGHLEWIHACQRPDRYLATSAPNQLWIKERAPWLRTRLIPNGVDCVRFSPQGEVAELPLKPPIILFVGAMDPVKRPDLTIRAVARLNAVVGNGGASLLMIGDGRSRGQMERLGHELLEDRFLLLPAVEHHRLPAYYRACSAFTLASPAEPFGIVFLEAMACNLPVIAHRGEVQQWLLGAGGVCCDCEEEAEYAAALQLALEAGFADKPRTRAKAFDWGNILPQYEAVFAEFS